eukprot:scaffold154033_cov37-Tisochrysis_lutea.AAC.1
MESREGVLQRLNGDTFPCSDTLTPDRLVVQVSQINLGKGASTLRVNGGGSEFRPIRPRGVQRVSALHLTHCNLCG